MSGVWQHSPASWLVASLIQFPEMGGYTEHPCRGSVIHVRPYLGLIQQESSSTIKEGHYPVQGRDSD
ncbi:hypothetical protein E2C01_044874 [Portunus trituberculatus]|uniref:Uncharacterized protein n=1 Tax=Portunus trituberculatus TaxID=210409 RepID=A0A5B7G0B1_PORTR|nr:hypothetical protein [Portunus trituberculatus]